MPGGKKNKAPLLANLSRHRASSSTSLVVPDIMYVVFPPSKSLFLPASSPCPCSLPLSLPPPLSSWARPLLAYLVLLLAGHTVVLIVVLPRCLTGDQLDDTTLRPAGSLLLEDAAVSTAAAAEAEPMAVKGRRRGRAATYLLVAGESSALDCCSSI